MGTKKKLSFKTYLEIDKGNLNDSLAEIPSIIYDFGLKQAKLETEVERLELKLDLTTSNLSARKRIAIKNADIRRKAPTETTIKDQINMNPEVIEIRELLIDKRYLLRLAKLKMKSLVFKKEMVENISHNVRKEQVTSK